MNFSLEGKRVPAVLHEISTTGGLAQFTGSVREGTLAELHMRSKSGPISGLVEMLRPITRATGKMHPFRFVALGDEDHDRLSGILRQMIEQGYGA